MGQFARMAWIERVLTKRPDGTLGAAEMLNTLAAGGLETLDYRIIRLDENSWSLMAKVGERAPAAGKQPAKAKGG